MRTQIDEKTSVFKLTWPIFIEISLFMVMGNIDTLMLSRYSDNSAAAVGSSNQIFNLVLLFFSVISSSMAILGAQYLGAGKRNELDKVYSLSFFATLTFGLLISILLFFNFDKLLLLLNTPNEILPDALKYSKIISLGIFIGALNTMFNSISRVNGFTRATMYFSITANIINILGNYISLFGPFGLPIYGVAGVALSTVIGRSVSLIMQISFFLRKNIGNISIKFLKNAKELTKKMISIGIPSAGEPLSWQFSQIAILAMINTMGPSSVTSKVYISTITLFTYLLVVSISQSTQIIVGHLIGMKKIDEAYSLIKKYTLIGIGTTFLVSIPLAIWGKYILRIFTDDINIINLGVTLLFIDVFLEIGRAINIIVINSLKASGDYKFPVYIGIVSMWGISVLLSYIFGISFGLGITGIWIAMTIDEVLRGLIMIFRWRNGKWRTKALI
jgi:putative MATE family efflux protein